jgi:hypothetical protein
MEADQENDADALLDRLVASIAAIPDPIGRARECVRIGDGVRLLHARLADVRRKAIYEATLRPGATGRSVSDELGVSAKTISLASSEFRREDLALLHRLVAAARTTIPNNAEVTHAEAMLASSTAVGVLAHVVSQLSTPWVIAADADGGDDDDWWEIYRGFERAEYLSKLAGLQRSPHRSGATESDVDEHTPSPLRWPCRVLNAMPGIEVFGTMDSREGGDEWTLWWSIQSADDNLDIADVGPSPEGWLVSEWLVWLVRDYRRAGKSIDSRVTAPPPMINNPGAMMTFAIEADLGGPDAVDPHEFARTVIKLWSGDGGEIVKSGYFEIDWPAEAAQ